MIPNFGAYARLRDYEDSGIGYALDQGKDHREESFGFLLSKMVEYKRVGRDVFSTAPDGSWELYSGFYTASEAEYFLQRKLKEPSKDEIWEGFIEEKGWKEVGGRLIDLM